MEWDIEYTDEFGGWWDGLNSGEQESVRASVKLLGDFGSQLPFPHSSGVKIHGTAICVNCAFSTPADLIVCSTPSTLADARFC